MSERNQDAVRFLGLTLTWIGAVLLAVLVLGGCDGDVVNEIIECQLPPGHCQMDDEEFDVMFNALTPDAQMAYVEEWGQPQDQRTGFVSG